MEVLLKTLTPVEKTVPHLLQARHQQVQRVHLSPDTRCVAQELWKVQPHYAQIPWIKTRNPVKSALVISKGDAQVITGDNIL